jgi:hypothetical protein
MAIVDSALVTWLKDGALYASATDASVATKWGDTAIESTIMSAYALGSAATAEAVRQQDFLEGPTVIESHNVPGLRSDLMGRPVTIVAEQLGYAGGIVVFVIGTEEQANVERTVLTVLRKLV